MKINDKCHKKPSHSNHIYVKTNERPVIRDIEDQPYNLPVISSFRYPPKIIYLTSSSSNAKKSSKASICQASCIESIKNKSLCPSYLQGNSSRVRDGFIADAILHIIWGVILLGCGFSISIRTHWKYWITTLTGICLFGLGMILLIISFRCQHSILLIVRIQRIQLCIALIGFAFSIYQSSQAMKNDSRDRYGAYMKYTMELLTMAIVIKGVAIVNLFIDLILNTYLHKKRSLGKIDIDHDCSNAQITDSNF